MIREKSKGFMLKVTKPRAPLWKLSSVKVERSLLNNQKIKSTKKLPEATYQMDLLASLWKSLCSLSEILLLQQATDVPHPDRLLLCRAPSRQVWGKHGVRRSSYPPPPAGRVSWSWPAVSDKQGTVTASWNGCQQLWLRHPLRFPDQ